jgi:hypothetical protein
MNRRVSRRDFIKMMPAIAGAGIVSACAPLAAPVTLTPGPTSRPTWTPRPPVCATPTPIPIPPPTPVSTNFDVCAYYIHFRNMPEVPNCMPGYETVVPLYGTDQDPRTMKMDIKWAREVGVRTFVMPAMFSNSGPEKRLEDWFLPASEPPFDINYVLMYNPDDQGWDPAKYRLDTQIRDMKEFLVKHTQDPRYKRLPDGKPVVFYYCAQVVAYWFGVDKLEQTAALLRESFPEDIFLVGDVIIPPYQVQTDSNPSHQGDYVQRQVKAFDGITSYYIVNAGYIWHSDYEWNHVVTPFQGMIKGFQETFDFWADKAHKYGSKMVPAPMPTGTSNRLLYEAGVESFLWDRHDGVSYETAKEMAELGAKYADPDLKMVVIAAWNECSEGAAIVPSVGYKFNPAHALRDTFATKPAGGWPEDYYPTT